MTLDEIQGSIAAIVDQDENTSNISTADYSLRLKLINRRERSWAEIADWNVLFAEYNTQTSTISGNVTVALPSDFRKPAGYPIVFYDTSNAQEFIEIPKAEQGRYTSSDRYVYYGGTGGNDAVMVVHPGSADGFLVSGASIYLPYYKSPASLASPADKTTSPNPEYLVKAVIADIWESRDDPKFPQAKAEADRILSTMLEKEQTSSVAATNRFVETLDEKRHGFRWGK